MGLTNGFQVTTDMELAVLIGVALLAVILLVLLGRRVQPARAPASAPDYAILREEVRHLEDRVKDVEHNVNQVRTMMRALPTKDSVHEIGLTVARLEGDLKLNNAQTTATAKGVERIENWLMEEARLRAEAAKAAKTESDKKAIAG